MQDQLAMLPHVIHIHAHTYFHSCCDVLGQHQDVTMKSTTTEDNIVTPVNTNSTTKHTITIIPTAHKSLDSPECEWNSLH